MSQSIEDLLNGSGPAQKASTAPQVAEVEQPAPPEPETEDQPQEAAEPATGDIEDNPQHAAPPAATNEEPLDKKISAFQRKAEDETRKRQDYEKRLQEAERALQERDRYIEQVRQWQAQQQQQHEPPEIDLLDPAVAQNFIASQMQPKLYETRVLLSQEMYRSAHPDYDEMEQIFADQCERDPSLQQRLIAHPVPAKFAYEEGKRIKLMQEMADPDAYRAKLREEIMAEMQSQQQPAQAAQPVQTQAKPVPQPPTSLAGVPSAARNVNKQPWGGPTPLEHLLS